MSADIEAWPPPDEANAFESLCLDFWRDIWGPDSSAQKNGRSAAPSGVRAAQTSGDERVGRRGSADGAVTQRVL
jgi:hypothetical protein